LGSLFSIPRVRSQSITAAILLKLLFPLQGIP
jgi:hypothetical protein